MFRLLRRFFIFKLAYWRNKFRQLLINLFTIKKQFAKILIYRQIIPKLLKFIALSFSSAAESAALLKS